ncbi:MAG: glucose-6-phosphate dehydrogenase [Abitibacteriaceae bacterium]|nr:glucose-6-phosphate dehydrogenase [Abditibacteriaceae bacterium]MBV9867576.1 glucose-6-phosphate dehydrogenase [Abditibacteriaceae bacterium]
MAQKDRECPTIHSSNGAAHQDTPPCVLTIFGATGDLAKRKLLPALYNLMAQKLLPDEFVIVGYGRRPQDEGQFRDGFAEGIKEFARLDWDEAVWNKLKERIFYQQGAYNEAASFKTLQDRLDQLSKQFNAGPNRMFYMATPPDEFAPIIENLGQLRQGNNHADGWCRLIIEKPFGRDLASAHELNMLLGRYFNEDEVFRIDHYLGKETVQNILVLRFANAIWEPLWNNHYIDHVQIVVAEEVGVGRRAGYYESSGALRDMVVNHMMQLVSLVAMEPPVALTANAIRDEKVKVLRAIRKFSPEEMVKYTVRGQYEGYKQEEGVAPDSRTETYVAMKLWVDSWRFSGVPFYLRHGKDLPRRNTEIVVRWKDTPCVLFNDSCDKLKSNMLILRIQPNEGFALRANAKVPGSGNDIRDVRMDFDYSDAFGAEPPEAYERLLRDALIGDGTLFTRRDEAEAAWSIADTVLEGWKNAPAPFSYKPKTWGPAEADEFMAEDGRRWHEPGTASDATDS